MARNRPRQNMSLGPNNGGFGSGNSNNNNPGTFAGGGGGGGNNNNRPRNRNRNQGGGSNNPFDTTPVDTSTLSGTGVQIQQSPSFQDWLRQQGVNPNQLNPNRRQRLREQYQTSIASTTSTTGTSPTAGGTGSIFDDPTASQGSGDDEMYDATAWGLLNQAGIDNDPVFGSQQTAFLNDRINQWYQRWKGEAAINGEDRMPFDRWLMNMTGGPAPGTTPDLNYVQTQWGPAMKQMLAGMYQSQSPRNRGTDMRQWVAPKRTIQF